MILSVFNKSSSITDLTFLMIKLVLQLASTVCTCAYFRSLLFLIISSVVVLFWKGSIIVTGKKLSWSYNLHRLFIYKLSISEPSCWIQQGS